MRLFRYIIEALDRTLGNDWHQVEECAPADRQVNYVFSSRVFNLLQICEVASQFLSINKHVQKTQW